MKDTSRVFISALGVLLLGCGTTAREPHLRLDSSLTTGPFGGSTDPIEGYSSPQLRKNQNPQCSIAVTIAGGGTVSASVAYGFLEALVETYSDLPDDVNPLYELDYLSTASGGGHAAYLFVDMIREARKRTDGRANSLWVEVRDEMRSPRFRSSLSTVVLKTYNHDQWRSFLPGAFFDVNGAEMHQRLHSALASGQEACGYKGPISGVSGSAQLKEVTRCRILGPGDDVLRPTHFLESDLPVWIPNFTLYDGGVNVPFTPTKLRRLGIERISVGRNPDKHINTVSDLTMIDGLTMSSAFPGIGPFQMRGMNNNLITVADGGQSDNLGIENGLLAVANDAKGGAVGLVVSIDTSVEPLNATYYSDRSCDDTCSLPIFNAVPLLKHDRRQRKMRAKHGTPMGASIALVEASVDDVVDQPVTFTDLKPCETGFPIDRCEHGSSVATPWEREVVDTQTSEALPPQKVEDLIAVGRAMFRKHQGTIAPIIEKCAADRPKTQSQ